MSLAHSSLSRHRVLVALAAAVLVAAAVVAGLVLRDSDADRRASSSEPVEATSSLPSDEDLGHEHEEPGEELGHEHEGDHVDTVDPDIDPTEYAPFCEAFYVFAGAYSNAVEALDRDGVAPEYLVSAATDFRAVAEETEMTDEVRAGFEWFVDDVLRLDNDASAEEQLAWSTFLNSACPA